MIQTIIDMCSNNVSLLCQRNANLILMSTQVSLTVSFNAEIKDMLTVIPCFMILILITSFVVSKFDDIRVL